MSWPAGWTGNSAGALYAASRADAAAIAAILPTNATADTASQQQEPQPPRQPKQDMTLDEKLDLMLSVGEECVTRDELRRVLETKPTTFRLYDGFEPSGRMHIAQGVFKAMNVNKCTACGGTFVFWVADWFALMNDKMGGDLAKIKEVGKYLVEVWRAAGMAMERVEFRWASDEITAKASEYWPLVLDVARRFTLARVIKCCTIMGRSEGGLTAAQILYPLMQCTDIFFLKADVCQLGVDQRKVNMLARDYCDAAGIKRKPVILSHHMLYGLKEGQAKMSKSDPDSAVFMEDSADDVKRKLLNAYCPKKTAAETKGGVTELRLVEDDLMNPCLDYVEHVIFAKPAATFEAGGVTYTSAGDVRRAFLEDDALTDTDLKTALADAVNALIEPVRRHFSEDKRASDLVDRVRSYKKVAKKPNSADGEETKSGSVSAEDARRAALARALKRSGKILPAFEAANANAATEIVSNNKPIALVRAPPPGLYPTLGDAKSLADALLSAAKRSEENGEDAHSRVAIFLLADWSAIALDACRADRKTCDAAHALLAAAVNGVFAAQAAGSLANGLSFAVVRQSDLILERPSEYWIDVINAGRKFSLDDVVGATGQSDDPEPKAGPVVAALLACADVAAVAADVVVECDASSSSERTVSELAARFNFASSSDDVSSRVETVKPSSTRLHPLLNDAQRADGLRDDDPDRDFFLFFDANDSAKRKIKKAFCEPGNTDLNPPVMLAAIMLRAFPTTLPALKIVRSPENGGDVAYDDASKLEADFKSLALHPGDLKPAVVNALQQTLLKAAADPIHADKAAKSHLAAIKAFVKKLNKAKGGSSGAASSSGKKK